MIVIDEKELSGLRQELHSILEGLNRDTEAFERVSLRMAGIVREKGCLDIPARKEYVRASSRINNDTEELLDKVIEIWDYFQPEPEEDE